MAQEVEYPKLHRRLVRILLYFEKHKIKKRGSIFWRGFYGTSFQLSYLAESARDHEAIDAVLSQFKLAVTGEYKDNGNSVWSRRDCTFLPADATEPSLGDVSLSVLVQALYNQPKEFKLEFKKLLFNAFHKEV